MWYEETCFYHIYPLGLCGAEKQNDYTMEPVPRLRGLKPWIGHLRDLGIGGLYIGPLFESVGHGYETTDYRRVDRRLGRNEDLEDLVSYCHENGIRVILDAVFNHTGRDFFAFRDIREKRENSPYRYWYSNVDFGRDNSYHDGFSYANWGGYDLLAKLDLRNPEVIRYHLDTVKYWVDTFDIDGLRLDTADVLDMDFMAALRSFTEGVKPDFWLMGEVIHGDYRRWANDERLHAVTNYTLHKALYSGHNDHNYFEIAHTVKRQLSEGAGFRLYNFADNHDVERIRTILRDKAHYLPVHVLLYTLPGVPSVYYGSEFGIEGKKERYSDDSIRPCLDLSEMLKRDNGCREIIRALTKVRSGEKQLSYGAYREALLTTRQYAFFRGDILVSVNNDEQPARFRIPDVKDVSFRGALSGERVTAADGVLEFVLDACGGEIWIPEGEREAVYEPVKKTIESRPEKKEVVEVKRAAEGTPYEEMSVGQLQAEILACMAANGPVSDRMRQDVAENVYRDSLLNWVRSFRRQ